MKKLIAFFLAVMMIASMSVTVFAEANVGTDGDSATINVGGNFRSTGAIYKTISVDIQWEDMTFVYLKTSAGEWDPTTHEYVGGVEGEWSSEKRTITITNHSDTELTANLFFEQLVDVTGVFSSTGEMSSLLELDSAVGTSRDEAPSVSEEFGIIGGEPLDENTSIGMITVYIEAPYGTITEGPLVKKASLSVLEGKVESLTTGKYRVYYEGTTTPCDVEVTLSGTNLDLIVGQENYLLGVLTSDGVVHRAENLGDFVYNEAENCLTGNVALPFCDEDLIIAYSADEGATWTRLRRIECYMNIDEVRVDITAYRIQYDSSTRTYTVTRSMMYAENVNLKFRVYGDCIQYMPGSVTVALKNPDGTIAEQAVLTKAKYNGSCLSYNIPIPSLVEDGTYALVYEYNGEWVDTGEKVFYDVQTVAEIWDSWLSGT